MSDLVTVKVAPFNAESSIDRLVEDVTPTDAFYVRSNFPVPQLDAATHRVSVGGNVDRPFDIGMDELRALGTKTIATTMECAGNHRMSLAPLPTGEPWLGGAVSTGEWTGVPLRRLLDRAGVKSGTLEILVEAMDRGKPKDGPPDIPFARSMPLEKALHEDTLLVLEMNDAPLTRDHGAPLRLVVPTWYGMAAVKWVGRIEALTEPFTGYYQRNRYIWDYADGNPPTPVREMLVKSTIVSPAEGATVPVGPTKVHGKAWSGTAEIVKVEVAIDGGDTWQEARLGPVVGPYLGRHWELDWNAADPGRHAVRARATDAAGNVQPDVGRWNKYGYGSNGVQVVVVDTR